MEKVRKLQGRVVDIERTGEFITDEYGDKWERCIFTVELTNFRSVRQTRLSQRISEGKGWRSSVTADTTGIIRLALGRPSNRMKPTRCWRENRLKLFIGSTCYFFGTQRHFTESGHDKFKLY